MGDVRERMTVGAMRLLATKGLQNTSFSEVLVLSGAPRGSIYHHFPDGKSQMVRAAMELAAANALAVLGGTAGLNPVQVAERFLGMWRQLLERSSLTAGCSVLAVAVAADDGELLDAAGDVFRSWSTGLAEALTAAGLEATTAAAAAAVLIAGAEGAVVMARAERAIDPFDTVAEQLLGYVAGVA